MKKRDGSINKLLYTLLALCVFIIMGMGVFIVNAYGGTQPSVMGHSIGEMDWSESIPSLKADSLEAGSINLGGVAKTSWPVLSETDPTVIASVKDGVAWSELSGIPTDIADGDDVGSGYCYTHYSTSLTLCTCSAGEINKKNLGLWGWCTDYYYGATIFRPSGSSCIDVDPSRYYYQNTNVGLSCVCCA